MRTRDSEFLAMFYELAKKADASPINSELATNTDLNAVVVTDGTNQMTGSVHMGGNSIVGLAEVGENDSNHATNVNFVKKHIVDKLKHNITSVATQNDLLYLMGPTDQFSDEDDVDGKPFEKKDFHKSLMQLCLKIQSQNMLLMQH